MFFGEGRIDAFREMICSETAEEREKALAKVLQKRNEEQGLTILMVTHGNSKEFKGANRFFKAEEGRIDEL